MDGLSVIIDSGAGLPKKWYQQNGLVVVHSGNDSVANSLREKLMEVLGVNLPNVEVKYSGLMSPVLGRQFGPGAVGAAALYLLSLD